MAAIELGVTGGGAGWSAFSGGEYLQTIDVGDEAKFVDEACRDRDGRDDGPFDPFIDEMDDFLLSVGVADRLSTSIELEVLRKTRCEALETGEDAKWPVVLLWFFLGELTGDDSGNAVAEAVDSESRFKEFESAPSWFVVGGKGAGDGIGVRPRLDGDGRPSIIQRYRAERRELAA